MKIEFAVIKIQRSKEIEVQRFPTYGEAEKHIEKSIPPDLLGTVEFFIRKIFSNRTDS